MITSVQPYTMTSAPRLWALLAATRYISRAGIPGDLVECGVWRGGSAALMGLVLDAEADESKSIWLYDTFRGMTEPSTLDFEFASGRPASQLLEETPIRDGNNVWAYASQPEVVRNLETLGLQESRFKFVVGDVRQTLTDTCPDAIALLRLDTDFFDSTLCEMKTLFPRISVGGVLILDDYGHWSGAREAVDQYFLRDKYVPLMIPIDYSARILVKVKT